MAEPFVFHFKPGPSGEPLKMYIADVEGECGLCGAKHIQRFYHAAPFHALTATQLNRLATDVPAKLDAECGNCGERLDGSNATRGVFIWGFADDAGVLTAWMSPETDPTWAAVAHRRLDPQALPGFDRPPETTTLDDDWVEQQIERVVNPKTLWLELFEDFEDAPDDLVSANASVDYVLGVGPMGSDALLLDDHPLVVPLFPLNPTVPFLPGQELEFLFATPVGWLSESRRNRLASGEIFAGAALSTAPIVDVLKRAFDVGNLAYTFDEELGMFSEIETPKGITLDQPLSLLAIAQRAVYTGITPGEAARLTAEEIVGKFLGVWS